MTLRSAPVLSPEALALEQRMLAIQNKRVLYVEDGLINQLLVKKILGRYPGITLTCVETGETGLELLVNEPPDVLLLDMQLPGISGSDVLGQMRQRGLGTPVVAFSANSQPSDVEHALRLGAQDYVSKPMDLTLFKLALVKVLQA